MELHIWLNTVPAFNRHRCGKEEKDLSCWLQPNVLWVMQRGWEEIKRLTWRNEMWPWYSPAASLLVLRPQIEIYIQGSCDWLTAFHSRSFYGTFFLASLCLGSSFFRSLDRPNILPSTWSVYMLSCFLGDTLNSPTWPSPVLLIALSPPSRCPQI